MGFNSGFKGLSSSLRSSLHSPVASYLSGPNILLRTLFSNTLSLRYPNTITSKIIYSLRHLSCRNKSTGKETGWQLWIMTHWGHFGLANWKHPLNAAVIKFLQLTGSWRPKGEPTSESYKLYKLKLKNRGCSDGKGRQTSGSIGNTRNIWNEVQNGNVPVCWELTVYRQHTKYLERSTEWERTGVLGTNRRENWSVIFAMPVSPPVCHNLKARKTAIWRVRKLVT